MFNVFNTKKSEGDKKGQILSDTKCDVSSSIRRTPLRKEREDILQEKNVKKVLTMSNQFQLYYMLPFTLKR